MSALGNSRRQDGCDSANDSFRKSCVGIVDLSECRLHLDCLAVQRELPRRTVLSVRCRQKEMRKANVVVSPHAAVLPLGSSGLAN